ncbi:MAG: hypothetical protein IPM18_16690 [Phycisphaerales bacterium]|nr:hypothetical protein [Phycisphaerales bacterium]
MIARLHGTLLAVHEESVELDVQGVVFELMVSSGTARTLEARLGEELWLCTQQYFEGNPAGAHLIPRLIGFLDPHDRAFFRLFTRVKGISYRRGLRAMTLPVAELAAAIESGNVALLMKLPEIGKKTATQLVTELRGQLNEFLNAPMTTPTPPRAMTRPEQVAADILVSWGDRRAEAEHWVAAAVEADANLTEPDAIVRAAYRLRAARR